MAKNIIKDVAALLGVELGEEFTLDNGVLKYKITKNGLFYNVDNRWIPSNLMEDLICGGHIIVKIPWKPKMHDKYWCISFMEGTILQAECNIWCNSHIDYAVFKLGVIYRTREECEEHLKEDYKKLTGEEW